MKKRAIIIDDSKVLVKQLRVFFETALGFEVVAEGYNGLEAVSLFREHKPDIMTLDINMPIKGGEEALREIIAEFPSANIIMISAVRGGNMLRCMTEGAKGYIEKPLHLHDQEFRNDFINTILESFPKD